MQSQVVTISAGHGLATISFSRSCLQRSLDHIELIIWSTHAIHLPVYVCCRCICTSTGAEMNIAAHTNEFGPIFSYAYLNAAFFSQPIIRSAFAP